MRKKFWDYMDNPTPKKKAELTSEEQRFAERLNDKGNNSKPKATPEKKSK
tara:strand:- start:133 stop:282 length:150 start_codon:yes stop_codon:yes gene_type:complete